MAGRAQARSHRRDILHVQRRPGRLGLAQVLATVARLYQTTEEAIQHGRGEKPVRWRRCWGARPGALKLREIADTLALDLAQESRLAAEGEARLAQDGVFRTKVRQALKNFAEKAKH